MTKKIKRNPGLFFHTVLCYQSQSQPEFWHSSRLMLLLPSTHGFTCTSILGKSCAKSKGRRKKVKKNKLKRLFRVFLMQHFPRQNSWSKDHHKGPNPKPCHERWAGCKEFGKLAFDCTYMLMTTYWEKALNE